MSLCLLIFSTFYISHHSHTTACFLSCLVLLMQVVSFPGDFSCAVAGLIFLEYTASAQWSAELLVITYGGGLKSYLVR